MNIVVFLILQNFNVFTDVPGHTSVSLPCVQVIVHAICLQ